MAIRDKAAHVSSPRQNRTTFGNKHGKRPPRWRVVGKAGKFLFGLLTLLLVFLSLRGDAFGQLAVKKVQQREVIAHVGAFAQLPLTPAQVNALGHLVTHMTYKQLAERYVSNMTLDEEIGQLIMVQYAEGSYSSDLATMINQLHAGGVIVYQWQIHTIPQIKSDITQMQAQAQTPLFVSIDEEGGYVDRLRNIFPFRPSATDVYASGSVSEDMAVAQGIVHDLKMLGFNQDMAPDVDVQLLAGPDELSRTYGTTPADVIKYAGPFLATLQSNGIVGCIKHFPGLGDAPTDAHVSLPVINRSADQIYSTELAPYRAFIHSSNQFERPGMVMATDLLMPAIDPMWPAELSHTFITDILRNQLGYDGVVSTDALYMDGIAQKWSVPQAAVLALQAGDDMILGPIGSYQMRATIDAIKAALANGTLSKARIDEAATRIIALKMQYHLLPAPVLSQS